MAILVGCAAHEPAPIETSHPPFEAPPPPPMPGPSRPESVAIAGLMDSARADASRGRLTNAAATLERALRIEPKNPRLWHQLALVRLRQGDYAQAESLAARSNTWAADDAELKAANQRVIEEAHASKR
jgi:uncharacterized protein HemY